MKILEGLRKQAKTYILLYAFLLNLAIGYVDYVTGYEIGISVFYLAPISLVVWFASEKRWIGIIMSLATSITLTLSDLFAGKEVRLYVIEVWNTFVHFVFFSVSALLIYEVKMNMKKRQQLIEELQYALNEVKTLSGLLPMCSSCKKIRDDKGYWNQVDSYIRTHSNAEISHGLCPECAERLYPKYFKKEK